MRSDSQIKQNILDEFVFQPNIEENLIGVVVEDGVVMLTGVVDDFTIKVAAKEAVSKVKGVKAVAEDIEVKYGTAYQKTDIEIAKAIVQAFEWNTAIPENKIKVEVSDGWITLSGEVEFIYEKEAAKRVTEQIIGVKGINNAIEIEPAIKPEVIKENIIKALKRSADHEASKITIKVNGDVVKLEGKVDSLNQKRTAQKTAYYAPGVNKVENELVVMG
ncbi:BON domain-containing protein [Winogradskyella thalassocola]|uniref:Osmotically-inducible protein OsmY, contains BON domain n=1 Tax=Winogradskyella thalassocola TaxID=262004 RepID=A0A1G8BCN3_9FLAO|nr:BON domain-containing protein [Winogradskyella thalassocola]SDH30851.1 Osmotically-inducible protein OsmY, contains BON domain [Winogradskyella thalassocola]